MNEAGRDSANDLMTSVADLPWLQDVDTNSNGESDVWDEQWDVVYRDVILVDANQIRRGAFNLTTHDLAEAANFDLLKEHAIALASNNPIWQNDSNPMDVNNDGAVSPVGDVLTCINELNSPAYIDSMGNLPIPTDASHPYLDVNGDYRLSPVGDVLALINHLNNQPAGEGEGEGEAPVTRPVASGYDAVDVVDDPTGSETTTSDDRGMSKAPELIEVAAVDLGLSQRMQEQEARWSAERTEGNAAPEELLETLASDVAQAWQVA